MKEPGNEVAFPQAGKYSKQQIVIFLPTKIYCIPDFELGIKGEMRIGSRSEFII